MNRRTLLITATAFAAIPNLARAQATPFTVDGVVTQLKPKFPDVAKPIDPPADTFHATEDVTYVTRPSGTLQLDIYTPNGKGPFPAIVVLHGGGWESGSRQMERSLAKRLTQSGFAAVPLSYRLGPDGRFPGDVLDVKAGIRWLRAHATEFNIDPGFIGIVGGSAGGHLAAFMGATNGVTQFDDRPGDSKIQAVVDIDGAASFPDAVLIAREEGKQGATSRYLGGPYGQRREAWFAASPLTYVSPDSASTLFINSNGATPVLPGRPEMKARLNALGIASDIIDMPAGTPHPFWLVEPWFRPVAEQVAGFMTAQRRSRQ